MERRPIALVTGASSGIGAEFARQLAAQGCDLILVARRHERLEAVARELGDRCGCRVEALAADLADPAGMELAEARIAGLEGLDLLVNAAGFGTTGRLARVDLGRQLEMIQLHVVAAVRLCRAALPGMVARRRGAIVNVASTTAFLPLPGNTTYSGTKAFLVAFSVALQRELEGTGVRVQALCPGFTHTGFHDTPEYARWDPSRLPGVLWQTAGQVVSGSLRALKRGDVVYVPGFWNRALVALGRNRFLAPRVAAMLVQKRRRRR